MSRNREAGAARWRLGSHWELQAASRDVLAVEQEQHFNVYAGRL
jgi:hypothetical protein